MQSVYDMIGSEEPFRKLVDSFYAKIEQDTLLRPMFPDDLEQSKHWQFLFLLQYFGGPQTLYARTGSSPTAYAAFPLSD